MMGYKLSKKMMGYNTRRLFLDLIGMIFYNKKSEMFKNILGSYYCPYNNCYWLYPSPPPFKISYLSLFFLPLPTAPTFLAPLPLVSPLCVPKPLPNHRISFISQPSPKPLLLLPFPNPLCSSHKRERLET